MAEDAGSDMDAISSEAEGIMENLILENYLSRS